MKDKKEEILKRMTPIFCKVFDSNKLEINYDSSARTIKKWDSLAQISLIVGIERLFNIKFTVSELADLKNVGEIIDLILIKKK